MSSDFESVAEQFSAINEDGMSRVSKLARLQLTLEERVKTLEEEVKETKRSLKEVAEEQLPAAMAEYNMTKIGLEDGSEIKINKFYSASIPKDKADESFAWLVDNGFGDLIKNQVATNFVRGQEEQANKFAEELKERGMPVNSRKWVEPMSLKAWYKESIENGISIPDELFGGYIGEKAKITTPKKG